MPPAAVMCTQTMIQTGDKKGQATFLQAAKLWCRAAGLGGHGPEHAYLLSGTFSLLLLADSPFPRVIDDYPSSSGSSLLGL